MQTNNTHVEAPTASLEGVLIEEFLESLGHTRQSVRGLAAAEASKVLRAATEYGSLRLAGIEARAHYINELHRASRGLSSFRSKQSIVRITLPTSLTGAEDGARI